MSPRQKALAIFALVSMIVLSAALACAQPQHPMNPKTQIAWPGNCTGTSTVYNIVTNQCQANGTAANPAGSPGQGQYNQSGAFAGSSHVTYDANGFPTLLGNVNTQFNVQAYGAKGDGATDDQTAINATCTAAKAYSPAAVVYFPKPSSFYLTSTLTQCAMVSMVGQAPGIGSALGSGGVTIQGKPSQDIIHMPDPNIGGAPTRGGPSFSLVNLQLRVDDSVDASASFPHRWPGRWTQDGAITSTSTTLTATKQEFTCSDIGLAIVVKGAGVAGADLTTTISALPNCDAQLNGSGTVTLAAAASTTVSNARVYVSVPGASATQTLSNCAIAGDNFDGLSSNWTFTPQNTYSRIENVSVVSVSGGNNRNSCGIYFAPGWTPYGWMATHVNLQRLVWGIVEGTSDTNPGSANIGQDFQTWSHMLVQASHPWVSYDGGGYVLESWQIASFYGVVVSNVLSASEYAADHWTINIPEIEQATSGGHIWKGVGHTFINTQIAGVGSTSYLETLGATCDSCIVGGALTVNNSGNRIHISGNSDSLLAGGLVDNSRGNVISGIEKASPVKGKFPTRTVNLSVSRSGFVMDKTSDFLFSGNPNASYLNDQDMIIFPQDQLYDTYPPIVADTNSFSGRYIAITSSGTPAGYAPFNLNTPAAQMVIGVNVPAGLVNIYDNSKCPTAVTYQLQVKAGSTSLAAATVPCTTTYTTNHVTVDLSAFAGQQLLIGWGLFGGGDEVDNAWSAVTPMWQNLNGIAVPTSNGGAQVTSGPTTSTDNAVALFNGTHGVIKDSTKLLAGSGAGVTTGPTSGTTAGHMATFQGTNGQIQDGGTVPVTPLAATTSALGGSALTAGQCVTQAVAVTGAATTMVATASPSSDPGTGFSWEAWVSSANNATVRLCAVAAGTPSSVTYNVRVIQ